MSSDTFLYIVLVLVAIIGVLYFTLTLMKGSRRAANKKDTFRTKREIGAENVGEVTRDLSYREIAKIRNLPEARKIKKRPNPDVTKHISATAALLREQRRENEGEQD
jgi:hypothetical protein